MSRWWSWRRRPAGSTGGSGALGELIEVFQPSHQHVTAERERRRGEIRRTGTGAPPHGVDLDAGIAYLEAPPQAASDPTGPDATRADATDPGPTPP
ncbi:DUF6191 domain-containing protein [Cellulomonas fimi]|uniref:Uncharacterized protein n=1 Tax=Cellulomonas fimi TaxID=1708 RepID=A0A7Y0M0C9_CELFI|nr:DUF6191 domain-containing protein [Cellulomonas fimi]NMR21503.1 hypothetical protein [Cellulomonas fimi]